MKEEKTQLSRLVKELFSPGIHPIEEPLFSTPDGELFDISGSPIWTETLGKKLCIVDTDNRPFNEKGEVWGPVRFNWEDQTDTSPGVLNHYLFGE